MSDDIEREKTKAELENLEKLVGRYAQSRSLGLLIPLVILAVNIVLIMGVIELVGWNPAWWSLGILFFTMTWVGIGSLWLVFKLVAKYEFMPFADKGWLYSFFLPVELSFVGAGLIAMVVVHIYNRRIMRKIKEMRPFSEQQSNKSDS